MNTESRKEFCIEQLESKISLMVKFYKDKEPGVADLFFHKIDGMIDAFYFADVLTDLEYHNYSDALRMYREDYGSWKGEL